MSEWQSLDNLTWNGPVAIQQYEQVATVRKEEEGKRRRWCRMPLNCQCWQLLFIVPNDVFDSSPDNGCLIHVSPLLLLFLWCFINNEPCHCSPHWLAVLFQVRILIDLRYLCWRSSVRAIWCVSQDVIVLFWFQTGVACDDLPRVVLSYVSHSQVCAILRSFFSPLPSLFFS